MKIESLLLRWVARSSDALVSFIVALDAKLDELIARADEDVAGFEDSIADLFRDEEETKAEIEKAAAQQIADLHYQTQAEADELEAKAAEAKRNREVVANLKNSMPTSN